MKYDLFNPEQKMKKISGMKLLSLCTLTQTRNTSGRRNNAANNF